ncbi:hypothetical protein AB3R30_15000 [Leptolyngbyaceae cyanobacterium UHCC 1019]
MRAKGIKRGQTIELVETLDIPDGTEVMVEIIAINSVPVSDPLTSFIGAAKGSFATPEEVDQFIRQERDAWEV